MAYFSLIGAYVNTRGNTVVTNRIVFNNTPVEVIIAGYAYA